MDLDAGTFDEELVRNAINSGELGEYPLLHAAFAPAPETVLERLLWTGDMLRAIASAATAPPCVDYFGKHASVAAPRHPACVDR